MCEQRIVLMQYCRRSSIQVSFQIRYIFMYVFAAQPSVAPKHDASFGVRLWPMNKTRVEIAACEPFESRKCVVVMELLASVWSSKRIAVRIFRQALGLVALTIVMPATKRQNCGESLVGFDLHCVVSVQ